MTTLLLVNIGTRDVQLDDNAVLPAEISPKEGSPLARLVGAYLRHQERFAAYKDRIRLPMIEKALGFIAPGNKAAVQIVLFATDQPEATPARFRDSDTIEYAQLIRELLFDRYQGDGLQKKHILIRTTSHNPADYDLMFDFYREELRRISERPDMREAQVYLLVAGGTPQMNTMLLLFGSDFFGARARPIYVSPQRDRPQLLDTGRQIYRQALRRNLRVLLDAYAYQPALSLLENEGSVLESWQSQLLDAMLKHADARRNLDLEAARAAFDEVLPLTRELREHVAELQQSVADSSEEVLLLETIYLAQLAEQNEDWSDFLARLHRFSEGCMQLIAERLGVEWSDPKKRASYKAAWWNAHRPMLHELGLAEAVPPPNPEAENSRREVNRSNLRKIIERLARDQDQPRFLAALDELAVVDRPILLRNDIVHRFRPISRDEVERRAKVQVPDLLAAMRSAYQHAFGVSIGAEHPYTMINNLCDRFLRGAR